MPYEIIAAVAKFLETTCGLEPIAAGVTAALSDAGLLRSFKLCPAAKEAACIPLNLLVDGHHEISAHGLVVDRQFGSIGLIHVLSAVDQKGLNTLLEDAAYLRHLLGLKRTESANPLALNLPAIEVVLLMDADAPQAQEVNSALRETLRTSLRSSGLLHAISVNLALLSATEPERTDRELRRAFCWLLPSSKAWFEEIKKPTTATKPWNQVRLENFRCAGTRSWEKQKDATLHLFHGPNGSGKSTLAEGFEYAVTGHSTRLPNLMPETDEAQHYAPLVCRQTHDKPATAIVLQDDREVMRRTVPPNGAGNPPKERIHGGSLRLDQDLCDRLARLDSVARARLWLETFFSELDRDRVERRNARAGLKAAMAELVVSVSAESDEQIATQIVGEATKLLKGGTQSVASFVISLWGPSATDPSSWMESHGLMLPDILRLPVQLDKQVWQPEQREELSKKLKSALTRDLGQLDTWAAMDLAKLETLLQRIGRDSFDDSMTASAVGEHDRAATFNQWLRSVAMTNLLEKALVISRTCEACPPSPNDLLARIVPQLPAEELSRHLESAKKERELLHQRVAVLSGASGESPHAREQRRVSHAELTPFLDAVGAGFFQPLIQASDRDALRDLLAKRQSGAVGNLRIGFPEWTQPLLELLSSRRRVLEFRVNSLLKPAGESSVSKAAKSRSEAVVQLIASALKLAELESSAAESFFGQLASGELSRAVAELVALLTPARWAYDPIQTQLDLSGTGTGAGERLDFQAHGMEAARILNTAELNTLALALYLLCAPRVDNPYRVVFLDDPLQNMDELTVAAVARGLARLMRLWSTVEAIRDWNVVLLLHSEEDCERILLEAPAAYYRIPWMAPLRAPVETEHEAKPITAENRAQGKLIELKELLGGGT